jgi:trehalose 6-phosphate phosphatase
MNDRFKRIDPRTCALFLDVDGTLVEIASDPAEVVASKELVSTLARLHRLFGGAVAVITGRQITDADRILSPLKLVAAGVHGAQLRRSSGGAISIEAPRVSPMVFGQILELVAFDSRLSVEDKGNGVAIHYRNAPEARAPLEERLHGLIADSAQSITLCRGRMVFEILPAGANKSSALSALLALPEFTGRRPVVVGDDEPDEKAFAKANEMGGYGLRVAGEHFARATADFAAPSDVRGWLTELVCR